MNSTASLTGMEYFSSVSKIHRERSPSLSTGRFWAIVALLWQTTLKTQRKAARSKNIIYFR
jgi:hypothetical protein